MKGIGKISKKELNRIINGRGKIKPKDTFQRKASIKPYKRQNIDYTKLSDEELRELEDE